MSNLIFRSAERYAAQVTTHFVTVATAMEVQYRDAGIGEANQYTRIFSGFNLTPFLNASNNLNLRRSLGIQPDDFVIGKIARLFKLKGHDDLFDAAPAILRSHPKTKFLLVGDGEWRQRFTEQARALRLEEHFIFTGLVPPDKVPALIGIMDTLVHLSRREGLARALPQALAAGKPVISYDVDGAREVCLDGETGLLIRPSDRDALVDRIVRLAHNPDLRQQLGNQGRKLAAENFSTSRMVDALESLYRNLWHNITKN